MNEFTQSDSGDAKADKVQLEKTPIEDLVSTGSTFNSSHSAAVDGHAESYFGTAPDTVTSLSNLAGVVPGIVSSDTPYRRLTEYPCQSGDNGYDPDRVVKLEELYPDGRDSVD